MELNHSELEYKYPTHLVPLVNMSSCSVELLQVLTSCWVRVDVWHGNGVRDIHTLCFAGKTAVAVGGSQGSIPSHKVRYGPNPH